MMTTPFPLSDLATRSTAGRPAEEFQSCERVCFQGCAERGMAMLVLNKEQLSPDKALKQDIGK
jgi:hypothetical protein